MGCFAELFEALNVLFGATKAAPCKEPSMEEMWKKQRSLLRPDWRAEMQKALKADFFDMTVETDILPSDTITDGVHDKRGLACSVVRTADNFFDADAIRMTLFLEGKRSCTTYVDDEEERTCCKLVKCLAHPDISDAKRLELSLRLAQIRGGCEFEL
mmetsp:Transcript_7403/g.13433  ORF Transcript_7403/g.13433 Transcript_7403/m.13433 type:complete len:157 (+) Transcript_7403:73-543(+)